MRDPDEQEIGGTKGKTHDEVLAQTLGREDGLRVATGLPSWRGPVVEGEKAAEAEAGDVNAEITDKKLERHGDVGGEK